MVWKVSCLLLTGVMWDEYGVVGDVLVWVLCTLQVLSKLSQ
jgi:hypothetical protein